MVWRIRAGKMGGGGAGKLAHYLSDAVTPDHEIRLAEYLTRAAPPPEPVQAHAPEPPAGISIVPIVQAPRKWDGADVAQMRREEMLVIRNAVKADAERIAIKILGAPNSTTKTQLHYSDPKTAVTIAGPKAGLWHCWTGNAYGKSGGNLIDLAQWKFGGVREGVQWLRDQLGLPTPDWSKPLSTGERHAIAARVETLERDAAEKRVRDAAEVARQQEAVAIRSQARWAAAAPAVTHPYLTRKGVSGDGLRVEGDRLLLPLRDTDGKLWAVQSIAPDGTKLFPEHGRMQGTAMEIGDARTSPHVTFAEGYATGRALHELTGFPVVVCWNAHNKHTVMGEWKRRHPGQTLIDAADNDHVKAREPGKRNAGADMAERLRRDFGAFPALPPFAATDTGTDWQDYIAAYGRAKAAEAFADAIAKSRRQATGVAVPSRDMHPGIAAVLKVDPRRPVNVDQLAHILAGKAADGSELPGAGTGRPREVAFYEFVISDPKSISVAYALAKTPEERVAIVQARRNAIDGAFKAVANDIACHQKNGVRGHIAAFDVEHINSRPVAEIPDGDETALRTIQKGDPNLHTHRIVPNIMWTDDGKAYALNNKVMRDRALEFDSIYQALLAAELGRIGIRTTLQDNAVEISSIPKWVRDGFSKRDQSARAAAREWAHEKGFGDWDALPDRTKLKLVDGAIAAGKRDKGGDFGSLEDWRQQAVDMGYDHTSPMQPGRSWEPVEARHRIAYDHALPLLDKELTGQSVIPASTLRAVAARGLIAAGGAKDWRDVSAVTRIMWREGVMQDGQRTMLAYGRDGEDGVWVFTKLHERQERAFVRLAAEGARDRSASLPEGDATARARDMGLDLSGAHGQAQARAMEGLATGGRVAVAFGAAGSGKTTMLAPVVDLYRGRGWDAIGVSLANRQANELTEAGIDKANVMAIHPFLQRVNEGKIPLTDRTLLVVDEVALLGTRQGLELLEIRERIGFKMIAVGGPEQSQSIEAGSTTDLFVRALGRGGIPNIESTIRQHDPVERQIAGMFRDGMVRSALAMKLDRGSAEFVPGGREECIERVAAEYARIRREHPGQTVAIGTSSHRDAHAIGEAVRGRIGLAGPLVTVDAVQGDGTPRSMEIAKGERVRLYGRTWGRTADGRNVHIGDNGHIVEVVRANKEGAEFRNRKGEVAAVRWAKMQDPEGRIRLSYGYAQTTIIVQGATEDHYLAAFVSGSRSISANAAYVHGSRHRHTARMFFSDGAERKDIVAHRQPGETGPITRDMILDRIAENLGKPGDKETVARFLERATGIERAIARDFGRTMAHGATLRQAELAPENQRIREGVVRLRDRMLPEKARERIREMGRTHAAPTRTFARKL